MTELVVAIAIFVLVAGLLGFPLYSAFGYLQKAVALYEAQTHGQQAAQRLERELSAAVYIFDPPIDGSSLSFIPEYSSSSTVNLVRYLQTLDFPWVASGTTWSLLAPNAADVADAQKYRFYHAPFYEEQANGTGVNPYILGRTVASDLSWATADAYSRDDKYPMSSFALSGSREELWRQFRNNVVSITPYGADWDVSRFQAIPTRVVSEALLVPTDENGNRRPVSAATRYPYITGRNRDLDDAVNLNDIFADPTQLAGSITQYTPRYPFMLASSTASRRNNPYGYQVKVFDKDGGLVSGINSAQSAVCYRHFMDWPPLDRPDWPASGAGLWTAEDIRNQREDGQFVFAQPINAAGMSTTFSNNPGESYSTGMLPIPTSNGWQSSGVPVYVVNPPRVLRIQGITQPFNLVNKKPSDLGDYEFCQFYAGDTSKQYLNDSRLIAICQTASTLVPNAAVITNGSYTICDLQPSDTVVATYSTKAVMNIGLTLSHQDRAGGTRAQSRRDYAVNLHIKVRNMLKRAAEGN